MDRRKLKVLAGIGVFALSVAGLVLTGTFEGAAYYQTVGELRSGGPDGTGGPDGASRLVRVAGDVVPGSIEPGAEGRVSFWIEHEGARLHVRYTGREPLPDTLVDRAQAVAVGRLHPDGTFEATQVQAKCASKYEAAYADTKT